MKEFFFRGQCQLSLLVLNKIFVLMKQKKKFLKIQTATDHCVDGHNDVTYDNASTP